MCRSDITTALLRCVLWFGFVVVAASCNFSREPKFMALKMSAIVSPELLVSYFHCCVLCTWSIIGNVSMVWRTNSTMPSSQLKKPFCLTPLRGNTRRTVTLMLTHFREWVYLNHVFEGSIADNSPDPECKAQGEGTYLAIFWKLPLFNCIIP